MLPNLLNLPGINVVSVEETEHDYHIKASTTIAAKMCPHCFHPDLYAFGRREQFVRDLPMHGKRVGLYLDTQRYRCKECLKTFYHVPPVVDEKRQMTRRLAEWVGQEAMRQTFVHIADETGIAERTVKLVFDDYAEALKQRVRFETPTVLGIDEIHLIRRPRAVFSNIQHCSVIEMLPDRDKQSVIAYLAGIRDRERIQVVTMDMWVPYRDAVATVMPWALIVIDKFHVLRSANYAMDEIRKQVGKALKISAKRGLMHDRRLLQMRQAELNDSQRLIVESWLGGSPELKAAYEAKESLFNVYQHATRQEAEHAYAQWEIGLTPAQHAAFKPVVTLFRNWRPYIFNYFDRRFTNACTENANGLIRILNRMGRGYSFEALRAKVLFTTHPAHKVRRPAMRRREMRDSYLTSGQVIGKVTFARSRSGFGYVAEMDEDDIMTSLGVDVSTLARLIEAGQV